MPKYDLSVPDFLASIHDIDCTRIEVIDTLTRKPISGDIQFADAEDGYYVVCEISNEKPFRRINFKLIENKNIAIRRYLDDTKEEYCH